MENIQIIVLAVSLVCLIVSIAMLLDMAPPELNRKRCPACGYDLAGLPQSASCPECAQTADSRMNAINAVRPTFDVMRRPLLLAGGAYLALVVVTLLSTQEPLWVVACAIITFLPHVGTVCIVFCFAKRLTPRGAAALASCILAVVTIPLTVACILFNNPRDAMAAVGLIFAIMVDMFLVPVGMLIGAVLIRRDWFRDWPVRQARLAAKQSSPTPSN